MCRRGIREVAKQKRRPDGRRFLVILSYYLRMRSMFRFASLIAFALPFSSLHAQDVASIQSRLVGHPLYLRGMWSDNWLEFNNDGTLRGKSKVGSLTAGGVDVLSVKIDAEARLEIRAQRVLFGWSTNGTLVRSPITAKTTVMNEFGHKLDSFSGEYEVRILVRPDGSGSFDRALHAIFADGLQELAASAPKPWTCWAQAYFVDNPDLDKAQQTVDRCIQSKSLARAIRRTPDGPDFVPPRLISDVTLPFSSQGVTIHSKGTDDIAFTVSTHGIAVGLQIRRAHGFEMDEAVLQGVAEAKYAPATIDGIPVVADMDYLADLDALTQ